MKVTYYTIPPPPALAGYVRFFWVYEIDFDAMVPYIYRSMADGCPEMVFHYKGDFREVNNDGSMEQCSGPRSMVHAQSARYRRFVTQEHFGIFGAYLYPFAIPYLFGQSSASFSNQLPDLQTLLGAAGRELEEKIMLAVNNHERTMILSTFLQTQLDTVRRKETIIQSAVRHLVHSEAINNIGALSDQYYLSTRQFERKFKEYAGFAPKTYSRIIRFQSALKEYGNQNKSLTEIAYQCGYYDQSHFIHDFKEFSGYHPRQYFSGKPEGAEYREV